MQFEELVMKYLNSIKFANGLSIIISEKGKNITSRFEILKNIVKNKNVIHLGCCDHIPLIEKKINQGIWLHKIITDNSEKCLGIDIDSDALMYVKRLGYSNVIFGDITSETKLDTVLSEKWNFMVMGEILEHVDNPTYFLKKISNNNKGIIDKIIITVPNALTLNNFINAKKILKLLIQITGIGLHPTH